MSEIDKFAEIMNRFFVHTEKQLEQTSREHNKRVDALEGHLIKTNESIDKLATSVKTMSDAFIRFEERSFGLEKDMSGLKDACKEYKKDIDELHDKVLHNTMVTKVTTWVAVTAVGAFLTGSVGFIFWILQNAVVKP